MIGAPALLLTTIGAIELLAATRLMPAFGTLALLGRQSTRLLVRTGVSEWAKERAMRLLARRLLAHSLRTMGLLMIVALPILALLIIDARWPIGARAALTDWPMRIVLLVVTSIYALLRRKQRGTHPARPTGDRRGERLLQRVALGSAAVRDIAFDIERQRFGRAAADIAARQPIFIAGLARAGTTILMRALHDGGDCASLSYRDLPFPLAPNSWAQVAGRARRHVDTVERGHGDGLAHDLDTPEAIEELFWKHHEGPRYCTAEGLRPIAPTAETTALFEAYVRLVLHRYARPRYISKNNNNILRLPALVAAFPDAILVHPFRDPLQQAASLRAQHRRACALAADDPFRGRFMSWMGHHEFGADRRPFRLTGSAPARHDPDGIDHWLAAWIETYAFLLDRPASVGRNQVFVDYDALCRSPAAAAPAIGRALAMRTTPNLARLRIPAPHAATTADRDLLGLAQALHQRLRQRCVLGSGGETNDGPPIRAVHPATDAARIRLQA